MLLFLFVLVHWALFYGVPLSVSDCVLAIPLQKLFLGVSQSLG